MYQIDINHSKVNINNNHKQREIKNFIVLEKVRERIKKYQT
jgi:hypothetical protein